MSVIKGRLMTRDPHMVGPADQDREWARWKPPLCPDPVWQEQGSSDDY